MMQKKLQILNQLALTVSSNLILFEDSVAQFVSDSPLNVFLINAQSSYPWQADSTF